MMNLILALAAASTLTWSIPWYFRHGDARLLDREVIEEVGDHALSEAMSKAVAIEMSKPRGALDTKFSIDFVEAPSRSTLPFGSLCSQRLRRYEIGDNRLAPPGKHMLKALVQAGATVTYAGDLWRFAMADPVSGCPSGTKGWTRADRAQTAITLFSVLSELKSPGTRSSIPIECRGDAQVCKDPARLLEEDIHSAITDASRSGDVLSIKADRDLIIHVGPSDRAAAIVILPPDRVFS